MKMILPRLSKPVEVRFFADFDIQVVPSEIVGFTTEQRALLQAIIASPPTLQRVARMRVETDLAGLNGIHFGELYTGPFDTEILECVLQCLSENDRAYWERLREGPGDTLHQELMPVFLTFEATLRRSGLEELDAAIEPNSTTAD